MSFVSLAAGQGLIQVQQDITLAPGENWATVSSSPCSQVGKASMNKARSPLLPRDGASITTPTACTRRRTPRTLVMGRSCGGQVKGLVGSRWAPEDRADSSTRVPQVEASTGAALEQRESSPKVAVRGTSPRRKRTKLRAAVSTTRLSHPRAATPEHGEHPNVRTLKLGVTRSHLPEALLIGTFEVMPHSLNQTALGAKKGFVVGINLKVTY